MTKTRRRVALIADGIFGIFFAVLLFQYLITPTSGVLAGLNDPTAYGEGAYGECLYQDGCVSGETPVTPVAPVEDTSSPTTGQSTGTDEETLTPTTRDESATPDEVVTPAEESPVQEPEATTISLENKSMVRVVLYSLAIFFSIVAFILLWKSRHRDDEEKPGMHTPTLLHPT